MTYEVAWLSSLDLALSIRFLPVRGVRYGLALALCYFI